MDLKEYFTTQEEKERLHNEEKHASISLWLFILEKSVYGFSRGILILFGPLIKLFEKLADFIKYNASHKQRELFVAPSFFLLYFKKLKNILGGLFKKIIKSFAYLIKNFEGPTFTFIHDWLIAFLSIPLSLFIIGNCSFKGYTFSFIAYESILFTLSTLGVFFLAGLYEAKYRPPLLPDIMDHAKVVFLSMGIYIPLYYLTSGDKEFPAAFLVVLTLIFLSGLLLPRLFYAMSKENISSLLRFQTFSSTEEWSPKKEKSSHKKILLIGSTPETVEASFSLAKEKDSSYEVIGLIQEVPIFEEKQGTPIKILGRIKDFESILEELTRHHKAPEEILITEFHPKAKLLSYVLSISNKYSIPVKKVVSHPASSHIGGYRPLVLEDFFPSFNPGFDGELLKDFVKERRFLITGAAGSLGTALVQKIALLHPQHIILIDYAEGNLFKLETELTKKFPHLSCTSYLCDVTEYSLLSQIIEQEKPQYIFHLAGIKQVSYAEKNPNQAVLTNIMGLKNVADLACLHNVQKVIFPSTLQAHHPRNVLEVTKRIAEGYLQYLTSEEIQKAQKSGKKGTEFCIVRLENILGSSGSVASLFREDIHHHKEITLTHLDMKRSFISLRDAALFLLTISAIQDHLFQDPEVLSEVRTHPSVKIIDLAQYLTLLAGYTPGKEVTFQEKGLRPGEYIASVEEDENRTFKETSFPGVYLSEQLLYEGTVFLRALKELKEEASQGYTAQTLRLLHYLVPSFKFEN